MLKLFIEGAFFGAGFALVYAQYEYTLPWLYKKYFKKTSRRTKKDKVELPLRMVK